MLLLSLLLPWDCNALDRCLKFRNSVIRESRYFVGIDAPWHLFLGQIEQESRCNEGITAFDGGMGLGQFMPETADWIQEREKALQDISIEPLPYDPRWSIRALILYDHWLHGIVTCRDWHYAFRAYNGGAGNINKEIRLAASCEYPLVEQQCKRKLIKLKNGRHLDMCRVNIEYPYLVYQKGGRYR